jgi:hypothetical protein
MVEIWGFPVFSNWILDRAVAENFVYSVDMFRFMTAVCFRRFRVAVHAAVL